MNRIRLAIFASGSGSNAENIIRYFSTHQSIEIALVLSNKNDAFVLERAKRLGVPSAVLSNKDFREENALMNLMSEHRIDFIVLAGFMLLIPEVLVKHYPNRIVNIHPALLPKFGGKGMYGDFVHRAVVESAEKESGITIHLVNERYDEGSIVFQAVCPVLAGDTPDDVAQKVHALEYAHFPRVISEIVQKEFSC